MNRGHGVKAGFAVAILAASMGSTANSLDPARQYNYLAAALAYQSTDWGPYPEETNATFLASAALSRFVHVHARYNNGDTYLPAAIKQQYWLTYGIGLHYYLTPSTSILIGYDEHHIKPANSRPSQRGDEAKIGIRHDLNARWRLTLEAGEHDLVVDDDTTFIAELIYHHGDNLGFDFRVRDYDKLDLSSYELGVRWSY